MTKKAKKTHQTAKKSALKPKTSRNASRKVATTARDKKSVGTTREPIRDEAETAKTAKVIPQEFDDGVPHRFRTSVVTSPVDEEPKYFEFHIDKPECVHLTYDEVSFAALDVVETKYPEKYYPESKILGIEVFDDADSSWNPVVSESDKEGIERAKKDGAHYKFLVLPDATYSVSPSFKMYLELCDKGVIDANKTPFDAETFGEIVCNTLRMSRENA